MRIRIVLALLLGWTLASSPQASSRAPQQTDTQPAAAARASVGLLDAVRSTLDHHPLLEVQRRQVEISQAQKQQRSADFDTQVQWAAAQSRQNSPLTDAERTGAALAGVPPDAFTENNSDVTGSVRRLLRSGIVIGPTIEMQRATDNAQNPSGTNRTRVSVEVTLPLLRGKGRDVVTAPETAAEIGVEASRYDLNQQMSDLVLSTAVTYWQYVASLRQLEIVTASEARGQEFVNAVTTLVQADKLPRSEVDQARANLAGRAAARIAVDQQVTEARSNLALAMGLPPEHLALLPPPADDFPDGVNQPLPSRSADRGRTRIGLAVAHRADYLAAEKKREAADVIRRSAHDRLRARLDLTVSGGYASLREGRRANHLLVSPFTRVSGPNAVVGLSYTLPPANSLASGQVTEAEASYQQALLVRTERERVIANDVVNALTAVVNSISRLGKANEAMTLYAAALQGERDKLRLGAGSITDILTVDARLTQALLDLVGAQQAYAVSLVQLRHASGLLVEPGNGVHSFEREAFFQPLPQAYDRQ